MSALVERLLIQAQVTPLHSELFIAVAGEIQALTLAHDEVVSQRDKLAYYAQEVAQVMAESDGVAGYHHNGNIATWEEVGLFDVPEFNFEDGGS